MDKPLRVGIIGLGAERGWATTAHIPALHALSGDFELAGVANTSLAHAPLQQPLVCPEPSRVQLNSSLLPTLTCGCNGEGSLSPRAGE